MLRNLIENALRYTNSGGVLVGCRRRGDILRIEVVDTGIGVAPEHADMIFDEFVQLANPERDRTKGLGLGLAIVRRLGDLLGHRVDFVTRAGRGSRFYIELPVVSEASSPPPPQATHSPRSLAGRVLVIDDEVVVLEALGWTLGAWGFEVTTAQSADDAICILAGLPPPQILLADYRLRGGATGVEAIDAVRAATGRQIPAILITGDTSPERLVEARASGNVLLHKPVSGEELHCVIERTLAAA